MQPFLTQHFGNPSSPHVYGRAVGCAVASSDHKCVASYLPPAAYTCDTVCARLQCKAAVEKARQQVATLIGASSPEQVGCNTRKLRWPSSG